MVLGSLRRRLALRALAAPGLAACLLLGGCGACEREASVQPPPASTSADPGTTADPWSPLPEGGAMARPELGPEVAGDPSPGEAPPDAEPRVALEDGLPAEVPRYPGARSLTQRELPDGGFVAGFETADAPETALEELRARYTAEGWAVERASGEGDHGSFEARRGAERVYVYLTVQDGETRLFFRADRPGR